MYNHLAFHLEKYALLALPNDLDEKSDPGSDSGDSGSAGTAKADIRAKHDTGSRAQDFDSEVSADFFQYGSNGSEQDPIQNDLISSSLTQAKAANPGSTSIADAAKERSLEHWLSSVSLSNEHSGAQDQQTRAEYQAFEQSERDDFDNNDDKLQNLIIAVKDNDIASVMNLLDRGIDPNNFDEEDMSPLMHALSLRRVEIAEALLARGADVKIRSAARGDALCVMVERHDLAMVAKLLEWGADINATDPINGTALYHACKSFSWELEDFELLLRHGADPNVPGGRESYPLMEAVIYNKKSLVELLLAHGANPNVPGGFDEFPVTACCTADRKSILPVLLDAGADPNVDTKRFGTALHIAVLGGLLPELKILLEHGANPNALGRRATDTPLHGAIMAGNVEMVRVLLRAGADRSMCINLIGIPKTALELARIWENAEIVSLLEDTQ